MSSKLFLWIIFIGILVIPMFILLHMLDNIQTQAEFRHPDIVLITIDTCRADTLGCYGNFTTYTPFFDRFARKGIQFCRGYSPIPTTAPSHTTMLTGKDPGNHKVFTNGVRYRHMFPTLATVLKDFGYHTGAFVSGYSLTDRVCGLRKGFEIFDDGWSATKVERRGGETIDACLRWLDTLDEKPMFLWVHLFDPHSPYSPPLRYENLLLSKRERQALEKNKRVIPLEKVEKYKKVAETAKKQGAFGVLVKDPATTKTDENTLRLKRMLYDAEVSYTDRCIQRLFDRLRQSGRLPRTAIIITSDHGEGFDHDYYFTHGDRLWESALDVPWLIRFPLDKPNAMLSAQPACHEDIFPTVMALTHSPVPLDGYPGENLRFLVESGLPRRHATRFAVAPPLPRARMSRGLLVSVTTGKYKLIRNITRNTRKLFDISGDPSEGVDIQDAHAELCGKLDALAGRYIRKHGFPKEAHLPGADKDVKEKLRQLGYID